MQAVLVRDAFANWSEDARWLRRVRGGGAERFRFRQLRQTIWHDLHERANVQLLVELSDVARLHANATVARRPADEVFLRRTVNINAASKSAGVVGSNRAAK